MKWPTVPMNPIRHSSAHHSQPGNACHASGKVSEASSVPTQPV
jgi:hypothetical protein